MPNPVRPRLVSTCSPEMKEFVTTYCMAEDISESALIRNALAKYIDYILTPADADPYTERKPRKHPTREAAVEVHRAQQSKRHQLIQQATKSARERLEQSRQETKAT